MSFICMRTEKCFHIREDHIAHHTLFNRPSPPPPYPLPPKKKGKKNYLSIVFAFSWDGCNTQ